MRWGNWIIGACCALFVAVIVTPTGLYQGVWKLVTGKDAAAWVQAIGSLGAIAAAIWVAWTAGRQSQLAARAEAIRTIELVCGLGYQLVDVVDAGWAGLLQRKLLAKENFELVLRLVEGFPVDRYPSAEMALRLAGIHRLAAGFVIHHEQWREHVAPVKLDQAISNPLPMERLYELVNEISENYYGLIQAGQILLDALPGSRIVLPVDEEDDHSFTAAAA